MRNTLIKQSILSLAIALISLTSFAQPTPEAGQTKKDKIEQLKIAYITKELDLTTAEAEKFWPAYNEMSNAIRKEKKSRREKSQALKTNFETLTEAEIQKKATGILDSEIAEAKLKKEHTEKIAKIIGYKKAVQLLNVEQRFKKELLKKLNERQGEGQPRPNRPGGNRVNQN